MHLSLLAVAGILSFLGTAVAADLVKVEDQSQFMALIDGKELKRPFVQLEVSTDGAISGRGAAWPVSGNWTWREGYFCRDLFWGGDSLGYNCQEVKASADRIMFTSDKGAGDSAEFRLR